MTDTDLPVPPWRRTAPKRATVLRKPLSQDQIVDAGLRIVTEEGIDAVSMRRVAATFGTGASSLYAHVANKDELLQLMFDRICAGVPIPEPDPARWKDQIKQLARDGYAAMAAHGDVARAALATVPTGPNALRVTEAMLSLMIIGGVPPKVASWSLDRLFLYIVADAYESSIYTARIGTAPEAVEAYYRQFTEQLAGFYESLPAARFPYLRKHARDLVDNGEGRFEFGLNLLIDGLDRYVEGQRLGDGDSSGGRDDGTATGDEK